MLFFIILGVGSPFIFIILTCYRPILGTCYFGGAFCSRTGTRFYYIMLLFADSFCVDRLFLPLFDLLEEGFGILAMRAVAELCLRLELICPPPLVELSNWKDRWLCEWEGQPPSICTESPSEMAYWLLLMF